MSARVVWRRCVLLGVALLGLAACTVEPPIRIGFLGSLTDDASRFSEDARNGVMLGIELRNQSGGVAGRRIEVIVQDTGVDVVKAVAAFSALRDEGVDAVIGPYSSEVAIQLLPLADAARLLMLCPTVEAISLVDRDNYLFRLSRTTQDSARSHAQLLHQRGHQRIVVAKDVRNAAYATSWSDDFRAAFTELGGTVLADVDFGADATVSFDQVVRAMLAGQPDGLLFVADAADAARLAQQARKRSPALPLAAVDWAANGALMELGGQAVEGMLVAQAHKLGDDSPRYRAFHDAYVARFGREPSYSAIASHDALTVLTEALARAKAHANPNASLRDAVLLYGPYDGLQQTIRFDRFGDATRTGYFSVVRQGRFEALP